MAVWLVSIDRMPFLVPTLYNADPLDRPGDITRFLSAPRTDVAHQDPASGHSAFLPIPESATALSR